VIEAVHAILVAPMAVARFEKLLELRVSSLQVPEEAQDFDAVIGRMPMVFDLRCALGLGASLGRIHQGR
jgi:hypothetical protein